MNSDRLFLLRKYLISTILSALFYSLLSWYVSVSRGPIGTFYYLFPILGSSILVYLFYFGRLRNFEGTGSGKNDGGIFFVGLVFFAGIVVTSMAAVKMTDEYDQQVTVLETPDQIGNDHSEYIHVNKYEVKHDAMVSGWNYSTSMKKGVTTNKLDYGAYVPLIKKPSDTVPKMWIKFKFRTSWNGIFSDEKTKHYQDSIVSGYTNLVNRLNYDTIVFFSRDLTNYRRLPDKQNEAYDGEVLLLSPYYETLAAELKDDVISYSGFYAASIALFFASLFFVKRRQ